MTQVAFHFGAPDKLAYALRLLRKASATGARILVVADADLLPRLDAALWASAATDFRPHCVGHAAPQVLSRSPIVLAEPGLDLMAHTYDVLVNLSVTLPPEIERYQRVIEVVSTDDEDRAQARPRWKWYAEHGYAIDRHDLQLRS
ncbi:MAG: DNA polymerase III subunit chi [Betaproteobacteria bacterium]